MADSTFKTKLKRAQETAERKFEENSDEAWAQIKAVFGDKSWWIAGLLVVLLITVAVFGIRLISSIRAPGLANVQTPVTASAEPGASQPGESGVPEVIDDSNTEQPLLSGARKENYYTFLLFGTDKEGTNTDTIMVVSYDVKNQKLNLMSIPRDTMVNVPWDVKKINSVYGMRGISGFKKQIGKLIGFVPDFYVKIDLQAFIDVVDLIGGVEFDVPVPMHYHDPYQGLNIDLEPGLQTLNGEQAMGLVRFRKSDRGANGKISGYDDTGRVQTQQAFLKAMFKQCLTIRNWTKITGYVEIFQKNVESDLTLGNMLWFARQAMNLSEDGFSTVTAPGNYYASAWSRSTHGMQSYVTIYAGEMVSLVNESFNPYLSNVTRSNLDIMSVNSDGSVASSTGYVADGPSALPPNRGSSEPKENEEPAESEQPVEGETPPEGETPGEGEDPAAGETPGAGETPAGETPETPADPGTGETPPEGGGTETPPEDPGAGEEPGEPAEEPISDTTPSENGGE